MIYRGSLNIKLLYSMNKENRKSYILPMAMMFALYFMLSFVTGLQNPMGVIVKNQFGVSNLLSQLGNAVTFIAYLCMGIPAGLLLQKIGYRKTVLVAISVGIVGVGISYLSGVLGNFAVYVGGAFVTGLALCMFNTVVNPMVNTLAGGGARGNQFLQLGGTCNSLGATIVPVLVGMLIGEAASATIADTTPALLLVIAIFVVAFIVFLTVRIPEPHISTTENKVKDKYSPLSFRHFVFGIFAIFCYVGTEVSIPNILNLYMTSSPAEGGLAMDAGVAGTIVGTYWALMLVGRMLAAMVGTRVTGKQMLVFVSIVAMAFVVAAILLPSSVIVSMPVFKSDISFGLADVPVGILFLVLCGLCTSVMWGNIFNLAVEGLGKYTAAASGIFMTMVCGGGILPLIQAFVADRIGYTLSFIVVIVSLSVLLWYALSGSKNVNKDIPVE